VAAARRLRISRLNRDHLPHCLNHVAVSPTRSVGKIDSGDPVFAGLQSSIWSFDIAINFEGGRALEPRSPSAFTNHVTASPTRSVGKIDSGDPVLAGLQSSI
jgi:hypothetical protein